MASRAHAARYETWVEGLTGDWNIHASVSSESHSRSGTGWTKTARSSPTAWLLLQKPVYLSIPRLTSPMATPNNSEASLEAS